MVKTPEGQCRTPQKTSFLVTVVAKSEHGNEGLWRMAVVVHRPTKPTVCLWEPHQCSAGAELSFTAYCFQEAVISDIPINSLWLW